MEEVTPDIDTLKNEEDVPISVLISIIHRSHSIYVKDKIKDDNISYGQFSFLIYLNDKENITQNELANNFKMTDGVVTRALQKLEKNNYITRVVDSNNQRRKLIKITPKGKELAYKLKKIEEAWEKEVWEFTDNNLNNIKEILQKASLHSLKE